MNAAVDAVSWLFDYLFEEIEQLTPHITAAKVGTPHEGHDGWGMRGVGPGTTQCGCGQSLDEAIHNYSRRSR